MQIENRKLQIEASPWPHRWAVVLACATFPLLWVGGLVTTTDAGMAVPDWPTTFGYNPFLYPISTWLSGPWDIFVEHGHRLLASIVGLITIVLAVQLWRNDDRGWVRSLGLFAVPLVVSQGILGGMRVVLEERGLAMIHGITGPLFFAVTIVLAVCTSRRWRIETESELTGQPAGVARLAIATCILVYLQMMLGAVLRHVPVAAQPETFALAVKLHLTMAGLVSLHIVALVWMILKSDRKLAWHAVALFGILVSQLLLGAGTWIVKYAVPPWAEPYLPFQRGAIIDGSWLQTHIVTAHMALGSALLAIALSLALVAARRRYVETHPNARVSQSMLNRKEALA
jgi:cytochrome c oxidase assembly protein subunit 15